MPQRPPVTPEVVDRAVFLEELDLAPDGETAYVVRRSTKGLEYPREIWAVPLDRSAPRRLTNGPADRHPRVSVDGSSLAFLSKRRPVADERAADVKPAAKRRKGAGVAAKPVSEPITQVWILPLGGGEAWQLTREEHDVSGFAWSPSGERIAFWGWRGPARFLIGKRDDGKSPTARRIAVGGWRWNETGHLDHRTHLSVVDVREGAPSVPLTEGDYDVSNPRWEPNGRSVLFSAARHELADLYPRPGIWRVAARHADEPLHEPVEILRLRGVAEHAIPSPDGRWLAVIGSDEPEAPDDVEPQLFVAPADGSGSAVPVAPDLDLPIGAWQDTDLNGWMSGSTGGAFWRESDGQTELVALVSRRGRCDPWRFPVDARTGRAAGEPEPLAEGDAACWQLAVAGNGRVAVIGTLGGRAMEVMEPT
ncbi:MAG: hypothetical protein QOH61_2766, partial [Chloroflexota bacterium]|nr:hypothetical protein [Chloroflexota bacterium]